MSFCVNLERCLVHCHGNTPLFGRVRPGGRGVRHAVDVVESGGGVVTDVNRVRLAVTARVRGAIIERVVVPVAVIDRPVETIVVAVVFDVGDRAGTVIVGTIAAAIVGAAGHQGGGDAGNEEILEFHGVVFSLVSPSTAALTLKLRQRMREVGPREARRASKKSADLRGRARGRRPPGISVTVY